jgi:hypothetical protein
LDLKDLVFFAEFRSEEYFRKVRRKKVKPQQLFFPGTLDLFGKNSLVELFFWVHFFLIFPQV